MSARQEFRAYRSGALKGDSGGWRMKTRSALAALALAVRCAPALAQTALSPADFTVGDIRVEGLQRVSEGTVYNYLPVNIGDHLTPQRVREAIRALYATGFFRDVQLRRDANTLIVVVLERPSIESFEITGNKDIKTEDLQKSLRNVGLATGKTFDRSVLEDVTQYLTDQYFARGKYGVKIDSHVEEETGNRVKIKIEIKEGARAKIRQINLVGATRFPQKEILQTLELKTPNWLSWYRQDDRYSRESLQGDLEKVRNFYMDRGYANFQLSVPGAVLGQTMSRLSSLNYAQVTSRTDSSQDITDEYFRAAVIRPHVDMNKAQPHSRLP